MVSVMVCVGLVTAISVSPTKGAPSTEVACIVAIVVVSNGEDSVVCFSDVLAFVATAFILCPASELSGCVEILVDSVSEAVGPIAAVVNGAIDKLLSSTAMVYPDTVLTLSVLVAFLVVVISLAVTIGVIDKLSSIEPSDVEEDELINMTISSEVKCDSSVCILS